MILAMFLLGLYIGLMPTAGKWIWDQVKDDPEVVKGEWFPVNTPAWFLVTMTMLIYPIFLVYYILYIIYEAILNLFKI
jgi:hypothetical protein